MEGEGEKDPYAAIYYKFKVQVTPKTNNFKQGN